MNAYRLLPALLFACAGHSPQDGTTYAVQRVAENEYRCPAERVAVAGLRRNTYKATACGREAVYQCTNRGGCENLSRLAEQRAKAEHDCAGTAVEISPFVFLVKGCSGHLVYQCEMRGGIGRCAAEEAQGDRGLGPR